LPADFVNLSDPAFAGAPLRGALIPHHVCARTSMTQEAHNRLPRIDEVCADDAEVLALAVSRYLAAGYMTGDVACWDAAYDGAERVLGPRDGQAFVAAMVGVLRAIRAERSGDWAFMPATCCRATDHEQELVALLRAGRQQSSDEVEMQACRLAGVPQAPRLTEAALTAGAHLRDARVHLPTEQGEAPRRPSIH
jgi:hypothetical protein